MYFQIKNILKNNRYHTLENLKYNLNLEYIHDLFHFYLDLSHIINIHDDDHHRPKNIKSKQYG
jgi:hypothetical protein